jgi:hypothetical protein
MGFRVGFYVTILAVGLLAAMGFGLLDRAGRTLDTWSVSASPLAGDNDGDNDLSDGDNDVSDEDNFVEDNETDEENETVETTSAPPPPGPAAPTIIAPPVSGPGQCLFLLGFLTLHNMLLAAGIDDGGCVTNEFHNPENGDGLQLTGKGMYAWRKADNWTAYTDGYWTHLNGPCGLQTRLNTGPFFGWEGQIGSACV